jgi:hypothetical protein
MDPAAQVENALRSKVWVPDKADPFFGPFLKIERANFHIDDLATKIAEFVEREPYAVVAEEHGDGKFSWTVRVKENIPHHWSTIIGDAIHNLRDALDLGNFAIPPVGPRDDRWTFFPSGDDEQAFERRLKDGLEKWASTRVIGVFKTGIQPYFGGHSPLLHSLHQLAIMDKHRLIVPVVNEVHIHSVRAKDGTWAKYGPTDINFMSDFVGLTEDGTILVQTPFLEGVDVGDNANASLSITFDKSAARVDYCKVVSTLLAMRNSVEDALTDLRVCFDPPPNPPI